MRKILNLILLVVFCLCAGRGWYWATDGFRLSRIEGFDGRAKERAFSEEANRALDQRYIYLSRGRQCFAFESEDGKYVLKFPRMDRYKSPLWVRAIPFLQRFLEKTEKNHLDRKTKLFNSFEISYDELQEDTATVAMFHSPTSNKEIELVDRVGRVFRLPLDETSFILQRKIKLFKDIFCEALERKDKVEMGAILDRLLEVVVRVAKKGILSKDGSFMKNFGFDGERAYQIDVGSFYRETEGNASDVYIKSIHASVETLRVWLLHQDPALLELIDQKLEPIYNEPRPKGRGMICGSEEPGPEGPGFKRPYE